LGFEIQSKDLSVYAVYSRFIVVRAPDRTAPTAPTRLPRTAASTSHWLLTAIWK